MGTNKTEIKFVDVSGSWRAVADAARTTMRMEAGAGEPSSRWKKKILLAEHSPIRKLAVCWKWTGLPYWVSTHFVRHKHGIEHFVSTQRTDRTGEDRAVKTQDAPVDHECVANAAEIMFISRKRLCAQAAPETRAAWKMVIAEIAKAEPELASCCVPECVYRGFCPEFKSCGYCGSEAWKAACEKYREI